MELSVVLGPDLDPSRVSEVAHRCREQLQAQLRSDDQAELPYELLACVVDTASADDIEGANPVVFTGSEPPFAALQLALEQARGRQLVLVSSAPDVQAQLAALLEHRADTGGEALLVVPKRPLSRRLVDLGLRFAAQLGGHRWPPAPQGTAVLVSREQGERLRSLEPAGQDLPLALEVAGLPWERVRLKGAQQVDGARSGALKALGRIGVSWQLGLLAMLAFYGLSGVVSVNQPPSAWRGTVISVLSAGLVFLVAGVVLHVLARRKVWRSKRARALPSSEAMGAPATLPARGGQLAAALPPSEPAPEGEPTPSLEAPSPISVSEIGEVARTPMMTDPPLATRHPHTTQPEMALELAAAATPVALEPEAAEAPGASEADVGSAPPAQQDPPERA